MQENFFTQSSEDPIFRRYLCIMHLNLFWNAISAKALIHISIGLKTAGFPNAHFNPQSFSARIPNQYLSSAYRYGAPPALAVLFPLPAVSKQLTPAPSYDIIFRHCIAADGERCPSGLRSWSWKPIFFWQSIMSNFPYYSDYLAYWSIEKVLFPIRFLSLKHPLPSFRMKSIIKYIVERWQSPADCTGLENQRTARFRGFKSHPLRHFYCPKTTEYRLFWLWRSTQEVEEAPLLRV